MRTALIDDHLLRDFLSDSLTESAVNAIGRNPLSTTNLWYTRLCRSVAASPGGPITGVLNEKQRHALGAQLVQLGDRVLIQPMNELAWSIATLSTRSASPT